MSLSFNSRYAGKIHLKKAELKAIADRVSIPAMRVRYIGKDGSHNNPGHKMFQFPLCG